MATKIQLRNDTSSSWSSANPILAQGEPGLETNTSKIKYGNGTSAWNCLPYANGENCGSACGVEALARINATYFHQNPSNIPKPRIGVYGGVP